MQYLPSRWSHIILLRSKSTNGKLFSSHDIVPWNSTLSPADRPFPLVALEVPAAMLASPFSASPSLEFPELGFTATKPLTLADSASSTSFSSLRTSAMFTYVDGERGESGELADEREVGLRCPKLGTNSRITDLIGFKGVRVICPLPEVYDQEADRECELL